MTESDFGPNGDAVERIIRRAERLTREEIGALYSVRAEAWSDAQYAAWFDVQDDAVRYSSRAAAWYAARGDGRQNAWAVAGDAAWTATRADAQDTFRYNARAATWYAAAAQVVADLVGQYGLTQDHIDTLMAPWNAVIGEDW